MKAREPRPTTRLGSETGTALGLLFLTLAVFIPVLRNRFAYDDVLYITDNPHVLSGLTLDGVGWSWTTSLGGNWHPLTWLSLMLDVSCFGAEPWGFHLTNVLLHAANALLLFYILSRTTRALLPSAIVAVLFAIHPLHVESVAWISERKDTVSTLFWMLATLAYVRYVEAPSVPRYLLIVLAFAVGLLAKPMLVTLPFVFLLLDYWPLGRLADDPKVSQFRRVCRLGLEKAPLFVLSVATCLVALRTQHASATVADLVNIPLWARFGNAAIAYATYIFKTIWPLELSAFYPHPGTNISLALVGSAAALLIGASLVILIRCRRYPYLATGWLWYLGTLVPVIGFVQIGKQAMADRYSYVPLIGIFIIVAWGGVELARCWHCQKLFAGMGIALLGLFCCQTVRQTRVWHDDERLWSHALEIDATNAVAHQNLGSYCLSKGNSFEAIRQFREALKYDKNYPLANISLGTELAAQGQHAEALRYLERAVATVPSNADWQCNLAVELQAIGNGQAAFKHFQMAIELDPEHARAHIGLGSLLEEQGRADAALDHYAAAVAADPTFSGGHRSLAMLLFMQERPSEAIGHFETALSTGPRDTVICYMLARAWGECGRWEEAVRWMRAAVDLQPGLVRYRCRLAYALWKNGQLGKARMEYAKALETDAGWMEAATREALHLSRDANAARQNLILAYELAEQACQASEEKEARYLDACAFASARLNRFTEAATLGHKALLLATAAGQKDLVQEIGMKVKEYDAKASVRH